MNLCNNPFGKSDTYHIKYTFYLVWILRENDMPIIISLQTIHDEENCESIFFNNEVQYATAWITHKIFKAYTANHSNQPITWWRHEMETLSALLAVCAENSRLSKQWSGRWFEMLSRPLWRHCNDLVCYWLHELVNMPSFFRIAMEHVTNILLNDNITNSFV